MKTYVINDGSSEVSLTDDSRVPYMIDGVSQRQVNPIYTTELVRKLRVRRTVTGNTRFISVVEPLGQGSVLTSVQRFNTHNTAEVTGLKIVSTNYTDYYFYANTSGTFTLTNETELVILEGKWGLIRVENGTATISGDVAAYQIPGVSGDMTQVRPPEIVPEGGTFVGGVSVSLSTIPPEASLYYTLDGSAPTTSSALYAGPFSITSSATLKVMGVANGLSDSAISSASFTIRAPVAPAAGFVLSTNFGTAPLKVTFSDTSTGDITNRFWSFGDGAETNTQSTNVMHTYTVAGTCTVTLVASGLAGVSTNIQTGAITVEPANNAGVTNLVADVNDQQRRSDGTVQVASSSTARVGTEATGVNSSLVLPFWIPDLDGLIVLDAELSVTIPSSSGLSLATGQANVDVYGVRSNPTNSLTVSTDYTDGLLLADNMFSIVSNLPIGEKTVTNAALTAWINDQIAAGGTYVFLTLRPDATASSYRYATLNTANESSGKPQLRLTLGYPAQLPLAASFTLSPASGQTPLTVSFTDTSTGSITNRFWAFGDGFTTNTSATSIGHTYTSNGVYVAQLVVSGGAGSSTNTQTVTVLNAGAPVAGFTALPVSGTAPLTVTFTDTSTGTITNRFWNFGNGVTTNTTATNVTHIYTNAGTYTVELVACGPGGVSTNRQNNLISVATPTTTVLSINGNTADQVRRSDGTAPSAASGNSRIGNDTSTSGLFCAWVVPFLLPDIGSETISAASILAFVEKTGGLPATSAVFLDLLGVRVSASNTVLSTDYQGTVVGDNLYNITSNLPLGAIEFSSAGLATWLQSIYDNDANAAGKYVFLTITPDATLPKYNYIDLTSASGTIAANRPVLRITLGSQSGTAGDADDDGLPDEWENQYFGGSTNAHPHALAANGVNTILEAYVAGLNPTNSEKFLSSVLRPPASGSILQWNAASGRVYSVYWTTNLLGGFQPLETNLVWPQNSWTDTVHSAEDGGFYRVKVQLQQ
jgi:PKD repeat protein